MKLEAMEAKPTTPHKERRERSRLEEESVLRNRLLRISDVT
jgi:hypothetical protein